MLFPFITGEYAWLVEWIGTFLVVLILAIGSAR